MKTEEKYEMFKEHIRGASFNSLSMKYKLSPSRVRQICDQLEWDIKYHNEEKARNKKLNSVCVKLERMCKANIDAINRLRDKMERDMEALLNDAEIDCLNRRLS